MRRHPEDEYGCIGCWRFDQGSGLYEPDVSGNSVNLTDNDGDIPTIAIPGDVFGDGKTCRDIQYGTGSQTPSGYPVEQDDRFEYGSVPSGWDGLEEFTVSAWVYIVDEPIWQSTAPILEIYQPSGLHHLRLDLGTYWDGDAYRYQLEADVEIAGGPTGLINGGGPIAPGNLYLMSFVYDSDGGSSGCRYSVWLNAVEVGFNELAYGGGIDLPGGSLQVAGIEYSTRMTFPGYMIDMSVYPVALGQDFFDEIVYGDPPPQASWYVMPDNLLKATVEAIAESDNEIGGHLVTRLRESHVYGRDDGTVAAANADRLVSPVDVFTAEMEGQGIDILEAPVSTGNQGSYIIDNYVDAQNVDLVKIGDGAAAGFVDESNVRWRFTTLRAETTWQFPDHDKNQRLWVGDEPVQIPYCELVQTPLAQEFRGIGDHVVAIDGIVSASGSTIETVGEFFTASMAGAAVWVFPKATSTGNEGPRRITVVTDSRTVTVSSPAFAADETEVMFAVKTYPRLGAGYLTKRGDIDYHRELAEVFEASGGYSSLDQLRRAILVDYATEEELDRIGSNLGVYRSWIMDDEMYRRYIMARAYLPATTVEAFEIILEALFPEGGWSVYEDQMTHPNEVFILDLPGQTPGTDPEGRTFLAPSGNEAGPPPAVIDPPGKGGREVQTSTSATTVDVEHPIISVVDVLLADYEQLLDMGVLPSADSPSWSYNGEGPAPPSEVSVFSVVSVGGEDVLEHGIFSGPSRNGGNYSQANTGEIDGKIGSRCLISAWWRGLSLTLVNDRPWCIGLQNTGIGKNVYLRWSETDIAMTNASGSIPSGAPAAVTPTADIDDGGWHRFELEIVVDPRGYFAIAKLDGQDLFGRVNLYPFSTATADEFMFGYEDTGNNQNWTVQWDRVQVWARSARNFYNYTQFEGDFVGGGASFDDITNSPFVAGDVGKLIRTRGYERLGDTFENRHDGLWKIDSLTSASRVVLEPVTHGTAGDRLTQGVTVTGSNTTINDTPDRPGTFNGALITIPDGDTGMFRVEDGPSVLHDSTGGYDATSNSADAKSILISGSGQGNDGSYKILEVISDRVVRVNNAGGFTTEAGLTWGFDVTDFQATAGLCEYEIVDRGSHAEPTITLGQSLPGGTEEVHCWYTSVLSGQVLRNEFVSNDGSEGTEPDIWYPFYIRDVDREIQRIIEDVSAAGVIPRFKREF